MHVRWKAALPILILVAMPAVARETVRAAKRCEGAGCFIHDRDLRFTITKDQVIRWKAESGAWTTNHVVVLVKIEPGAPWPAPVAVSETLPHKSTLATGPRSGQFFLNAGDWLLNINHPRMGPGRYEIEYDLLQPALEIAPRSVDFTGDRDVCKGGDAVRKLIVTNKSELDLTVTASSGDAHFRASPTSNLIPARSTASLDVIFRATGVAAIAATMTVRATPTPERRRDDTDVVTAITVRGAGAPAEPRMVVSPPVVEFRRVAVGSSRIQFFAVENAGRSPLQVGLAAGCCGADLDHFTPTIEEQQIAIAPCSVRTFAQRYRPRRSGSHSVVVALAGVNDPAGTLVGVVLRGDAP